jgi:methylated-DNA-[protein]-cysteine S-methyltransferase
MGPMHRHHIFATTAGFAGIGWGQGGVASFRLPAPTREEAERALLRRLPRSTSAEPPADIFGVIDASRRYFAGERIDFSGVVVDLGDQTPFFARVYEFVRRLKWAETTTYGEVARTLGEGPEAARAVGEAMARNPVPLIIPCHRVTAAGGRIGGFSAPGGSVSKARMLELEGVQLQTSAQSAGQLGFGF